MAAAFQDTTELKLGDPICCKKCGKWRRPCIGAAATFDACPTDSCRVMNYWQRYLPEKKQLSDLEDPKARLLVIRAHVNDMVRTDLSGKLTFKEITDTLSARLAAEPGRDYTEGWLRAQIDDWVAKHKASGESCAKVNAANRQLSAADLQRAVGPSGLLDVLDNDMLLNVLMGSGLRGTSAASRTCRRLCAVARAVHRQPTLTVLQGDNTIACALYAARLLHVQELRIERSPGVFEMLRLQTLRTPPWLRTPPVSTGQPHRVRLAWTAANTDVVLSPLGALYLGAALAIDVHTTSEADLGQEGMHTENYYSGLEAGGVLMGLDRTHDEKLYDRCVTLSRETVYGAQVRLTCSDAPFHMSTARFLAGNWRIKRDYDSEPLRRSMMGLGRTSTGPCDPERCDAAVFLAAFALNPSTPLKTSMTAAEGMAAFNRLLGNRIWRFASACPTCGATGCYGAWCDACEVLKLEQEEHEEAEAWSAVADDWRAVAVAGAAEAVAATTEAAAVSPGVLDGAPSPSSLRRAQGSAALEEGGTKGHATAPPGRTEAKKARRAAADEASSSSSSCCSSDGALRSTSASTGPAVQPAEVMRVMRLMATGTSTSAPSSAADGPSESSTATLAPGTVAVLHGLRARINGCMLNGHYVIVVGWSAARRRYIVSLPPDGRTARLIDWDGRLLVRPEVIKALPPWLASFGPDMPRNVASREGPDGRELVMTKSDGRKLVIKTTMTSAPGTAAIHEQLADALHPSQPPDAEDRGVLLHGADAEDVEAFEKEAAAVLQVAAESAARLDEGGGAVSSSNLAHFFDDDDDDDELGPGMIAGNLTAPYHAVSDEDAEAADDAD